MLEKLPADCSSLYNDYLGQFYTLLQQTLDPSSPVYSRRDDFQGYLCLAIESIFRSIQPEAIEFATAHKILTLTIDCFKLRKNVFDDAFIMISSFCTYYEALMDEFVPTLGPYIVHSLENDRLCKAGASLISDFCTMVQSEKIVDGFADYTPLLLAMLQKSQVEREGKLAAIVAIADTVSMTKSRFEPFFAETFKFFFQAAQHSTSNVDQHDREFVEYCVQLQGSLIEAFTSIAIEYNDLSDATKRSFQTYVEPLMEFIVKAAGDEYNPSEERLRDILGLLGDLARSVNVRTFIQHPVVAKIIEQGKSGADPETRETADWAEKQIRALFN